MTAQSDALADLINEHRQTGRNIQELAAEIATDYQVNPTFLIRKFNEAYPQGLPQVDLQKAEAIARQVELKREEENRQEAIAISVFFAINPRHLNNIGSEAHKIIRTCNRIARR